MSSGEHTPTGPPVPGTTRLDDHFWRGGASGRLLILRCDVCGTWLHPPTPRCRSCGSTAVQPQQVSGCGHVRTYTVNHQPWFAALPPPYVIAIVELVEQPHLQLLSRLVGCDPDEVRIGMEVCVRFEPHGDVHLPLFTPACRGETGGSPPT